MRFVTILAVLSALLAGCDDALGLCGNTPTQAVPSPDGTMDAVVFERDCGATVATQTHVSVLAHGKRPKGAGTVFIADANHGAIDMDLRVEWKAPAVLAIAYPVQARVFKKENRASAVHIEYATLSR